MGGLFSERAWAVVLAHKANFIQGFSVTVESALGGILIAAVLMVALAFIPVTGVLRFVLYLVPYLIIGYDILIKAYKGIRNRQVFDENFLMAVATVGAAHPAAVYPLLCPFLLGP